MSQPVTRDDLLNSLDRPSASFPGLCSRPLSPRWHGLVPRNREAQVARLSAHFIHSCAVPLQRVQHQCRIAFWGGRFAHARAQAGPWAASSCFVVLPPFGKSYYVGFILLLECQPSRFHGRYGWANRKRPSCNFFVVYFYANKSILLLSF